MAAPDSVVVIEDRRKDALVAVRRLTRRELRDEWAAIISTYPFPAFNVRLLSVFDNLTSVLSSRRVAEIAETMPRLSDTPVDGWRRPLPEPNPKTASTEVHSTDMSDAKVIECLNRFGPDLTIIAGELNNRVYTQRFVDVLFAQFDLFSKINEPLQYAGRCRIVCGPVVMIEEGWGPRRADGSVLPRLAKHQNVQIFCSRRRQKEHFRLASHGVYYETMHSPNGPYRQGFVSFYERDVLRGYALKADAILHSQGVEPISDIESAFIYLTETELTALCNRVEEQRLTFDDLDLDELSELVGEIGINLREMRPALGFEGQA